MAEMIVREQLEELRKELANRRCENRGVLLAIRRQLIRELRLLRSI